MQVCVLYHVYPRLIKRKKHEKRRKGVSAMVIGGRKIAWLCRLFQVSLIFHSISSYLSLVCVQFLEQQFVLNFQTYLRNIEAELGKITRYKSCGKLCLHSRYTWFEWFGVTVEELWPKHWTWVKSSKTLIVGKKLF